MRDSVAIHSSGAGGACGIGDPCVSSLNNNPTAGREKSDGKPCPARKVREVEHGDRPGRRDDVVDRTAGGADDAR